MLVSDDKSHSLRGLWLGLCERFCFFLLISVLVLFLNERCGYSSVQAVRWYGIFVSCCYLTSLLGGWLCDGKFSAGRVAFSGIVIQTIGFALLVRETPRLPLLILFLIALGAGDSLARPRRSSEPATATGVDT